MDACRANIPWNFSIAHSHFIIPILFALLLLALGLGLDPLTFIHIEVAGASSTKRSCVTIIAFVVHLVAGARFTTLNSLEVFPIVALGVLLATDVLDLLSKEAVG